MVVLISYTYMRDCSLYFNFQNWAILYIGDSVQSLSNVWLFATSGTIAHQAPLSMGFSSGNTGESCQVLLQGIFPTQGSNLHLLHFLPLSYQGSPWCPSKRIKKPSIHSLFHVRMKQKMAIYKLRHRFSADTKSPSTSILDFLAPKSEKYLFFKPSILEYLHYSSLYWQRQLWYYVTHTHTCPNSYKWV